MRALFTLAIFLGSSLLFFVQPMVAKMILPFFGGVPAVWNTCLVFFQALLLLGYAYAHYAPNWLGARAHLIVHTLLFGAAILLLPFSVAADFNPLKSGLPVPVALFGFLTVAVGLPYFVVSTGAPLMQKWFRSTNDSQAHDPYFLYAASNFGSVAALLAYPFWAEAQFTLAGQATLFKWGFVALAGVTLVCGIVAVRGKPPTSEGQVAEAPPIPAWQKLRWTGIAAASTSLLLAVTSYLATNIASVPLLWVVPLALFLVTYILAFKSKPLLASATWGRIAALALAPMALILVLEATEPFIVLAVVHLVVFFLAAMACHSELAETRPPATQLTQYFLWLSLGGVLGGAFNAILAPLIFDTLAEYPLALVAVAALRAKPGSGTWTRADWWMPVGVVALTLGMWGMVLQLGMGPSQARTALTMGLPAILCFLSIDKPLRFAASLGLFLVTANFLGLARGGEILLTERTYFGIHRIVEPTGYHFRQLAHGNTVHGRQNLLPEHRATPLTYYYPTGPVGEAILHFQKKWSTANFGFVGLGVGSLAAYGRPSDKVVFFEIDPVVIEIASNPKYFTYLDDSKADVRLVQGDARLSLADEPRESFDFIALDAFSSDSIPIHLLTVEAIQMYLGRLKPEGVLAVHISNRYLDLAPMLSRAMAELKLDGIHFEDYESPDQEYIIGKTRSHWVLLARDPAVLAELRRVAHWEDLASIEPGPLWTDDRSNLFETWKTDD